MRAQREQRISHFRQAHHGVEVKQRAGRFPLVWPSFRQGVPQWQLVDFESYVAEGFNLNTLIYSAIMYKVRALRSAPLRAYTGDVDQPERLPADDPLAMLVARPNQQQSWMSFHGQNIVYLNIAGNVYVWMIRSTAKGLPEQMYSLRPDRVYILPAPDKKTIIGYLYVPEGASAWAAWSTDQRVAALNSGGVTPIAPQDMAHIKLPHPNDPLDGMGYGLSPLAPLGQSADVDNSVTRFLKKFFDQGTMVTGLLSFDVPMETGDVSQARERWKEIYGGVDNWDIAVLDQGGKYQRIGMNFDEMGFETIDDRNESRILGPLGVPGILIGTRLGLNRAINANAKELRVLCWQDTLLPENALFEDELQYFLQTEGGGFVAFDYSKVEALKKDTVALVEAAYKLWSMAIPANLAARTVGLQVEDIPGGDVGYLPLSFVPVATSVAKPAVTQRGAPEAVTQSQQGKAQKQSNQSSNDAMIACYVGDDWGVGTVPTEDRHMTLAYIPNAAGIDKNELIESLELFSGSHGPLSGTVNATTVFENAGKRAFVALVDSVQLPYWRNDLVGSNLKNVVDSQHGYIPHITLSYLKDGESPPKADIIGKKTQFDAITLIWNPDQTRYYFSLDGTITGSPGNRKGKVQARQMAGH